jgi:NAD(P)-dependent dehydrogenase (short-subunit alcohol dehydrogenase family)
VTPPRLLLILTENWTMRPTPDVADLVRFAVDAASYVNGAVIPVDGSAAAVDVGTLPFDPRVEVRRQDGS